MDTFSGFVMMPDDASFRSAMSFRMVDLPLPEGTDDAEELAMGDVERHVADRDVIAGFEDFRNPRETYYAVCVVIRHNCGVDGYCPDFQKRRSSTRYFWKAYELRGVAVPGISPRKTKPHIRSFKRMSKWVRHSNVLENVGMSD